MDEIKLLLFDLDETLIVEWNSARESFMDVLNHFDFDINKDEFVKVIREKARVIWYNLPTIEYCLRIGISSWEALWADFTGINDELKYLRKHAFDYRLEVWSKTLQNFGISDKIVSTKACELYKEIRNTKHILYPDTRVCLEKLKTNYKICLITNGTPDLQWKKIDGGRLKYYFDEIFISGEFGYGKPDKRIFKACLDRFNCKNINAIMIGDSIKTDIQGAIRSGIMNVWINRENIFNILPEIHPNFELNDLYKLEELV
jgi:putative hydrolase of the HAD superfamily